MTGVRTSLWVGALKLTTKQIFSERFGMQLVKYMYVILHAYTHIHIKIERLIRKNYVHTKSSFKEEGASEEED